MMRMFVKMVILRLHTTQAVDFKIENSDEFKHIHIYVRVIETLQCVKIC